MHRSRIESTHYLAFGSVIAPDLIETDPVSRPSDADALFSNTKAKDALNLLQMRLSNYRLPDDWRSLPGAQASAGMDREHPKPDSCHG